MRRAISFDPAAFVGVDTWVFDLDNTLYPAEVDLFAQVDRRMGEFVARALGLPEEEARRLQKEYYRTYGTTLRGLMTEHGIAPEAFMEYVHDIDHSPLRPDPALCAALERLPGRRLVLTNGSRRHAETVLGRLGLSGLFEDLYDIAAANWVPKPEPETYAGFIRRHGLAPDRAAMFEDLARNLVVPHGLGMRTVLVTSAGRDPRADWEREGRDAPHVGHVTDDLAGFLERLGPAEADGE